MQINTYNQQTTATLVGNIAPASPGQISNPVAQGVGNLGQGITQVASEGLQNDVQQASFIAQQQKESSTLNAAKVSSEAQLQWMQTFQDQQRSATGTAPTFTKDFLTGFDEWSQKTISNYTDETSKNLLEHEFLQMRESFAKQGFAFQTQMFTNDKVQNVNGMVEANAALLAQDPNQYALVKAKTDAVIAASGLPEIERQKLAEVSKKTYTYSTMNNMLLNDPERGLNMLRPAIGQLPEGSAQSEVAKFATQSGVDQLYALSVTGIESGFNSVAKNKTSSASGLVQMTKATRERYNLPENATPQQQLQAFATLTSDNRNQLIGSLGREPSNTELYLAHHFGGGGAAQLLKSNKNKPVSDVVSQKVIEANPYMKGKTVGEVIDINNKKYNSEAGKYVDREKLAVNSHSVIKDLSPEDRVQYANRFQQEVDTRQKVQSVNLTQTAQDQVAMASTGNMNFQPLTQEQFYSMHPKDPAAADTAYRQYTDAIQLGKDVSLVQNMNPQQELDLVNSYTPRQEQGFAGDLNRQKQLIAAIQQKHELIQKDPADWAMRNSATVQSAFNKIGGTADPKLKMQATNQAYAALLAEQQRQGIQFPKLISKSQEDGVMQTLINAQGMDRARTLQQMAGQYGNHWPQVAAQLQQNKAMPQGITAIMAAPTPAAMQAASIASSVDLTELQKTMPNHKDVDDRVAQEMRSFTSSMPSEQLQDKTTGDMYDTITKVAYNNMRQGMTATNAAKSAVDMFVGKEKYNYVNNKDSDFTIRIPKQYNASLISENMRQTVGSLGLNNVDTGDAKLLRNVWNMQENADGYIDQVKSTGFWQTNSDETGARLFFVGRDNVIYPVKNKDGKQMNKSFQDLSIFNPDIDHGSNIVSGRLAATRVRSQ